MLHKVLLSILFLASLLNILPIALFDLGGDIDLHMMLIDCFAGQFWQGDLYPRWCMKANAGLGSPVFFFYFPLPYYIASLLYPLTHLGISLYGLYGISMGLATFVTGLACYSWLKDIVTPGRALLAALLFIFMPYRMEAMLFRTAHAEIWLLAPLPLVLKYTRRIALDNHRALLPLSVTFGLTFLTHMPGAVVAIVASGTYLLIVAWGGWLSKWRYDAALIWGAALAAFYLVPAIYYRQFMAPPDLVAGPRGWPNTFLSHYNLTELAQGRIVLAIAITLLALLVFSIYMLAKRQHIRDIFVRREVIAWIGASLVAMLLLFPVSKPLYELLGPLQQVFFPWRMQAIFMVTLTFLAAVWMQHFAGEKKLKTWKADFILLLGLMVLLSYLVVGVRAEESKERRQWVLGANIATQPEYRTRWIAQQDFTIRHMLQRQDQMPERVRIAEGTGELALQQFDQNAIVFDTKSKENLTVHIDHYHFPAWEAHTGELPLALYPQEQTGQMLLDIPAGEHRVTLYYAATHGNPLLIWIAYGVSTVALLGWIILVIPRIRAANLKGI